MSYQVIKYGWFGWNKMPAWIASRDRRPLRECCIRDLYANRAKLEVDRAYEIPDEFLMTKTTRRKIDAALKARIALEALRVDARARQPEKPALSPDRGGTHATEGAGRSYAPNSSSLSKRNGSRIRSPIIR